MPQISAPAFDRRNFLHRAIQLASIPAFPALLAACGGGGSDGDDATGESPGGDTPAGVTLSGQAVLPAGLSLAGASVSLALGKAAVSSTGAFQVPFADGAFCFSQVLDAAGNYLVFGFLRAEQPTLSTRSTAEALVYRGLGLWAHAPRVRVAALTLLRGEDLASVESAIVAAVAANGAAWARSAGAAGVGRAVRAKVTALIGTPPAAAAAGRKSAQGMIVSPTERVSGLIVEGDGIGACTVTNQFRRRALLWHTATRAKLEADPVEFDLPFELVKTKMPPMDGVSSPLQAVADLWFERKSLYTPVTASLETPRVPATAVYTRYKVWAVGPGVRPGVWLDLPQSVLIDATLHCILSAVVDFVLPLVASVVIPGHGDEIDQWAQLWEANGVLKDLVNALAQVPNIVQLLWDGKFADCCQAVAIFIRNTDTLQLILLDLLTMALNATVGPTAIDPLTKQPIDHKKAIRDNWSMFDNLLDVGEAGFTIFDSAIQALDIGSSSLAETWDVTVTKAKVTLMPLQIMMEKGALFSGITAVTADATEVEGKVFGYRWKCAKGHLSDGSHYGAAIDSTTADSVAYDAAGVPAGTLDQVEVEVFLSGLGHDDPVGSAKAKVYVTGVEVQPAQKAGLKANDTVDLSATAIGVRPLATGEKVTYKWTLDGTAGTLTATDTASATFKAAQTGKDGLAVVTVEAFLGEQRIGMSQSSLTVGDKFMVAGRIYEKHYTEGEYCNAGEYLAVPIVKGAKSYSVNVSGMRGPVFGPEKNFGIYVYPDGSVSDWAVIGGEYVMGMGGGQSHGPACDADPKYAAWYEGSKVVATVLFY